jgi:hypothetical protein
LQQGDRNGGGPPADVPADVVVDVVVSRALPSALPRSGASAPATVASRRAGERITVLTMSWNQNDPLAVHLTVRSTPDHPALPRGRWVILRDFLRYGLDEATGDGAVRLQPDPYHRRVHMRLARTGRPAWISAPTSVVRAFLDQTDQLDPTGEQRSADAIEAVLARLLR